MVQIALDTETQGIDFKHGAKPFIVTICYGKECVFWEWDVDPYTREPSIPKEDIDEIKHALFEDPEIEEYILQNPKFDVKALASIDKEFAELWEWDYTRDTLRASHLLASNEPHSLDFLAVKYLGVYLRKYEEAIEDATKKARNLCRTKAFIEKHGIWAIAEEGRKDMPSAKGKVWKFDMWLPRAVAIAENYAEDHPWYSLALEYANPDSSATLAVYRVMLEQIEEQGLLPIYEECLKLTPTIYKMEDVGITLSGTRLNELMETYREESDKAGEVCYSVADQYEYDLTLPKSGNNKSLTSFCFDELKLPVVKRSKKTGEPSLDKTVLEAYELILEDDQLSFIKNLRDKRKRDTAIQYMEGYKKHWKRVSRGWYKLHASLNPTGTDTLRFSSSNPNEQNISKKEGFNLRYSFGPLPGRVWFSLDAKNIELRIPAYESGEAELIELFERPDDPPYYGSVHLLNFSTVYPELWAESLDQVGFNKVGPHCKKTYESTWYQWCKNGDFAVQYGAVDLPGGGGTADAAFHKIGAHAKLKERFDRLEKLNAQYVAFANLHGYVETLPDKSLDCERGYPLLCTRSKWGGTKSTVPLNYHVQGSAMYWMIKAMNRVQAYLDELNASGVDQYYLIMQVHDELVLDFPDRGAANLPIIYKIKELMELGGDDLGLPTPVSVSYHPNNWSEDSELPKPERKKKCKKIKRVGRVATTRR